MVRLWSLLLACGLLVLPAAAGATEAYAEHSGQDCGVCHRDPAGGGPLTPAGEAFADGGYRWPVPSQARAGFHSPSAGLRILRFSLGFLHLATAVIWFGTIFYVHLVLRPKYALGGLPKAELRIAWGAILVLAATGVPLTWMRFHHLDALLATRSGNLLLVKVGLFLFLVASAAVATLVIGPRLRKLRSGWQTNDGRGGRPAWVRVGRQIYDLTGSARWQDGNHFRRHQAGQDLTDALAAAPHGAEKLEAFPARPALDEEGNRPGEPVVRTFYVMAYVNLLVALGVLVVISLWRWG